MIQEMNNLDYIDYIDKKIKNWQIPLRQKESREAEKYLTLSKDYLRMISKNI